MAHTAQHYMSPKAKVRLDELKAVMTKVHRGGGGNIAGTGTSIRSKCSAELTVVTVNIDEKVTETVKVHTSRSEELEGQGRDYRGADSAPRDEVWCRCAQTRHAVLAELTAIPLEECIHANSAFPIIRFQIPRQLRVQIPPRQIY
ncbi:hypothetical protein BDZ89DRAFT_1046340 [Hymenopellis radicata]|nr:hypothetical protein BDZ89DRAFT_1046340 [Hymenopellis radicata]